MADDEEEKSIYTGNTHDPSTSYKKYPLKPTFWQRAKEAFSGEDVSAELEVVRKRRLKNLGQTED